MIIYSRLLVLIIHIPKAVFPALRRVPRTHRDIFRIIRGATAAQHNHQSQQEQ